MTGAGQAGPPIPDGVEGPSLGKRDGTKREHGSDSRDFDLTRPSDVRLPAWSDHFLRATRNGRHVAQNPQAARAISG
jgi:hypothetical protein